jgi:hypothetical protein
MNTTSESPMAPQKSWWGRNWGWVLPVGCLSLLLSCGCLGALIAGLVYKSVGDNPVRTEALERARASPEVRAALGEPIQAGMMRQFSLQSGSEGGSADLVIPIGGPQGAGLLRARAYKEGERWHYTSLLVELSEGTIDLLDPTPGEPLPRPERPSGRPDLPAVEPLPEDDAPPAEQAPQREPQKSDP